MHLTGSGTWMKLEIQWNIHHQAYVSEREHDQSQAEYPIVVCVNASGGTMPSQIIVKGKTEKALNGFNKAEGPENAIWAYQQKAWFNDEGCVK